MQKLSVLLLFMGLSGSIWAQAEAILEAEMRRRQQEKINPAISVALIYPEGPLAYRNFGGPEITEKSQYEIGSLSKTFTAELALHLLGKKLRQPLSELLPKVDNQYLEEIRPLDLLQHQAGIPRLSPNFSPANWANPYQDYSEKKMWQELRDWEPYEMGQWAYSNWSYMILGQIIEQQTAQSYEQLLQSLFKKAKLKNTHFGPTAEAVAPRNLGVPSANWEFSGPSRYAAGLWSSTEDLATFLNYQIEHNILFQPGWVEDAIPTGLDDLGQGKLYYKGGWFIYRPDKETEILMHTGLTGSYSSIMAYNKTNGKGVVLLSNSLQLADDIALAYIYPKMELEEPQRNLAYDLAEKIEAGDFKNLEKGYWKNKKDDNQEDLLDIYWLERYHYGQKNYAASGPLSNIMYKILPEDWEACVIQAENLAAQGKCKGAKKIYKKAMSLAPERQEMISKKMNACKD
ncbi:serine hydrolase domain-containing protein [Saprospira grandis]|uniref:Beta-lactamase n=1 Tax=Saprospira grandis (strain Lewin) TaxID=984262 RepID=H6L8Z5_SAPGL|nr:serine hydrolase domain-containing protein [Saprospira grandis]AFC23131.1 beta-lactamase [Saprospira grandis str. Lewin]